MAKVESRNCLKSLGWACEDSLTDLRNGILVSVYRPKSTLEASPPPLFRQFQREVRRITLPRRWVNKGIKKKNRGCYYAPGEYPIASRGRPENPTQIKLR